MWGVEKKRLAEVKGGGMASRHWMCVCNGCGLGHNGSWDAGPLLIANNNRVSSLILSKTASFLFTEPPVVPGSLVVALGDILSHENG